MHLVDETIVHMKIHEMQKTWIHVITEIYLGQLNILEKSRHIHNQ